MAESGPRFCAGVLRKPYKGVLGRKDTPRPCDMGAVNRYGPKSAGPAKLDQHWANGGQASNLEKDSSDRRV